MNDFSLKEAAKTQWKVLGVKGTILMVIIYACVLFLIWCSITVALSDSTDAQNELVIVSLICDVIAIVLVMLSTWLYNGLFSETDFDV